MIVAVPQLFRTGANVSVLVIFGLVYLAVGCATHRVTGNIGDDSIGSLSGVIALQTGYIEGGRGKIIRGTGNQIRNGDGSAGDQMSLKAFAHEPGLA